MTDDISRLLRGAGGGLGFFGVLDNDHRLAGLAQAEVAAGGFLEGGGVGLQPMDLFLDGLILFAQLPELRAQLVRLAVRPHRGQIAVLADQRVHDQNEGNGGDRVADHPAAPLARLEGRPESLARTGPAPWRRPNPRGRCGRGVVAIGHRDTLYQIFHTMYREM